MNFPVKQPVDLNDLFVWIGENLPRFWDLYISVNFDEAFLALENPDGDKVDVCHDDLTTLEAIVADVNYARGVANLPPVSFPGLSS